MLSVAPKMGPDGQLQLHSSTVVLDGKAVVFTGRSGSGKSGHALAMMSHGAQLLSDDVTWFSVSRGALIARCPPTVSGRIEARGVGILRAVAAGPAPVHLVVDLGTPEPDRLPKRRFVDLLGHTVPLLYASDTPYFIDAIQQLLRHGLAEDSPHEKDDNDQ